MQRAPTPVRRNLRISPEGAIQAMNLVRGTGDHELDRWVQQTLLSRTFQPGLLDGIPTAMDHEQEVRIRARP